MLPKARREYVRALEYLSDFYPGTPLRFRSEFQRTMRRLEFNPFGCSPYPDNPDYRRALVGKYTLLYKIAEAQHEVHIHRILRSTWNIPDLLEPDDE